jgi:peptidoglycan/LPS O-acetylase OafA/YrhL
MNTSQNRLVFFDNLRYLMVLLVLVFHFGASYGSIVAFWPYHDPHPTEVVDLLLMILDVFIGNWLPTPTACIWCTMCL